MKRAGELLDGLAGDLRVQHSPALVDDLDGPGQFGDAAPLEKSGDVPMKRRLGIAALAAVLLAGGLLWGLEA